MSDNLELRDELAGLMGWTYYNNDGLFPHAWQKARYERGMDPDERKNHHSEGKGGSAHPVPNTLDAASAAIRVAGWWWRRYAGVWFANSDFEKPVSSTLRVIDTCEKSEYSGIKDTGDEVNDLLTLAVMVWREKNKETTK